MQNLITSQVNSVFIRTRKSIVRRARRQYLNLFGQKINQKRLKKLGSSQEIKLNLGSGPSSGINGWTNIDIVGADIDWDLHKPIPLPEDSVRSIYSSHLLEHLEFGSIKKLLLECYRLLVPDGELYLCVPNARLYIEAYTLQKNLRLKNNLYSPAVTDTESFIDQVNYVAYMGGEHRYMFDESNLKSLLENSGFVDVSLRDCKFELDDDERQVDSLYMKARKSK